MTANRSAQIQLVIKIVIPLVVWMLFSNIGLASFFTNHDLLYLLFLALGFSGILSQVRSKDKQPILFFACDAVVAVLGAKLLMTNGSFVNWLLVLDFCLANLLILTKLINEPHCQWIIYGIISGSGIVFLFNVTYHHYFSLMALMSITVLIFANIFFSFPVFMKNSSHLSLFVIMLLILGLCVTLSLSILKVLMIAAILGFYLFFEWRVNDRNYDKRNNTSLVCLLLFSLVTCL